MPSRRPDIFLLKLTPITVLRLALKLSNNINRYLKQNHFTMCLKRCYLETSQS